MQRLSTYWTLGTLIAHGQARLKDFTEEAVSHDLWMEIFNAGAGELQRLLELTDADEYRDSVVLTSNLLCKGGDWHTADTGVTYTNATKTLHIPTAIFTGGNFSAGITNFNTGANFLGAIVMFRPAVGSADIFFTRIASITGNNDVVLADAYGSDVSGAGFDIGAMIIPGALTSGVGSINIGQLSLYKSIDRINGIQSSLYGECYMRSQSDFWGITKPTGYHPHYKNLIIWYRDGEMVFIGIGTNLSTPGTLTMHYFHTPYPMVLDTDLVDIRDSEVNMLLDLGVLKGLETLKVPIPQVLQAAQSRLQALRQAVDEKKAKLLTDPVNKP